MRVSKFIKFIVYSVLFNLVILTLYRIIFYLAFSYQDFNIDVLNAFILGVRFDLQLLAIVFLIFWLFARIKFFDIFKHKLAKAFWLTYLILANLIGALMYVSDYFYYEHFKKRINATIIEYFYDFKDASEMFIEGYPIVGILVFFIVVSGIYYLFYSRLLSYLKSKNDYKYRLFPKIIIVIGFTFGIIFAGYGKVALFPLRWSDAFVLKSNFLASLASNPIIYFSNTFKNKKIQYDKQKVKKYYDIVANYLQIEPKYRDKQKLSFARIIESKITKINKNINRPNIVLVMLESFAYFRTKMSGNPLSATPYFDKMAEEGLLFNRFYVPTGTTAKSVFASLTGISDVEMVRSTSRNPLCVKQNMIASYLKDYTRAYLIGGSASWGNIRGIVSNIKDVHIYEYNDYTHPRNDVWGISDTDLAVEANEIYKKMKKPFFSYYQTSSNHSPFTIPNNVSSDFKEILNIDKATLNKYGFDDIKQYNATRYIDFAIHTLIETTKKEEYFKNTIFIFFGDHGLMRHYEHLGKVDEEMLSVFHVPFLVYAPYLIKPQVVEHVVNEMDIMATIASLTKTRYINTAFGFDITRDDLNSLPDYRLSISFRATTASLRLIGKNYIFVISNDGSGVELIDLKSKDIKKDVKDKHPKLVKRLTKIALGLYESMVYTRYFNSNEDIKQELQSLDK